MTAARKGSRWGHRDATMILIGYRHGLRAAVRRDAKLRPLSGYSGREMLAVRLSHFADAVEKGF
jgi:hypothetical protein